MKSGVKRHFTQQRSQRKNLLAVYFNIQTDISMEPLREVGQLAVVLSSGFQFLQHQIFIHNQTT
jgi:hypothetical protein